MTSLRHKLWLGFGALLVILLLVSALSVVVLTYYSRSLERLFHENYNSAVYCDAMKDSLDQLNADAEKLVWNSTPTDSPQAAEAKFDANIRLQLQNCTLPGELQESQRLADLWDQFKLHYAAMEQAGDLRADLYRGDLLPRYQELKQAAQRVATMNMSHMASVDTQVKATLIQVRDALLILAAIGALVSVAVIWAVGSAILHPLMALTRSARQIEQGNLDLTVPVRSKDEVGQLAEAFNSMALRLREFRRLDDQRLARTRQTTQLAIDSLPDAVFVISPDGTIEISNRSAQNHFGIKPGVKVEQLALRWLSDLYEKVAVRHESVEPQGYQSAIQLFENGEERFLLPRAVPMQDGEQGPIGVTVILVDVTRLRQLDEMKSGLVSTVSHELRTPLTSIRMALFMLAGDKVGNLSAPQKQLMAAARDDSDRLYRIIENLLSLSRIESGRAQFQFRPMSPGEIIAQSADPLRPAFAQKHLEFDLKVPGDLPEVMADPNAVGSALTNLLSNALKFTPAGGQVSLTAHRDGEFVVFGVHDNGPGIPEQFRGRIFEKFFRIPRPEEGPPGAGLGLAIAKEIVEAHGGQIDFRQREGGGSVLSFTLPCAQNLRRKLTARKESRAVDQ